MNQIAIIPARYGSTRFPGKPLAKLRGKTMIEHVYHQTQQAIEEVWVATDDTRIHQAVEDFNGRCVMTSQDHASGTDRINEALEQIEEKTGRSFYIVVNVQGDEPFIQPGQLEELLDCFRHPDTQIATLIKPVENQQEIFNENLPKVITDLQDNAIYFSRSPIPFVRNHPREEWIEHHPFMKHIGLYGYRSDVLRAITRLEPSPLEKAESLEQNRWLQNGYHIKTATTVYDNHPVDTPEDLKQLQ